MSAIVFTVDATGDVLGRWTRGADGAIHADGADGVLTAALRRGLTEDEVWEFYTVWSNGYTTSAEVDDAVEALAVSTFRTSKPRGKGSRDQRGRFAPPGGGSGGSSGRVSPVVDADAATEFSKGGAFDLDLYHGTAAREAVLADGFDFDRLGSTTANGGMLGSGAYLTQSPQVAAAYSRGADPLRIRTNVSNPVDMNSSQFQDAYHLSSDLAFYGGSGSARHQKLIDSMGGQAKMMEAVAGSKYPQTDLLRNVLQHQGFDSAVARANDGSVVELCVFDPANMVVAR